MDSWSVLSPSLLSSPNSLLPEQILEESMEDLSQGELQGPAWCWLGTQWGGGQRECPPSVQACRQMHGSLAHVCVCGEQSWGWTQCVIPKTNKGEEGLPLGRSRARAHVSLPNPTALFEHVFLGPELSSPSTPAVAPPQVGLVRPSVPRLSTHASLLSSGIPWPHTPRPAPSTWPTGPAHTHAGAESHTED